MKQSDFSKCRGCGRGMAADGELVFYRVTVEQFVLDYREMRRQAGFEMMMGSPAIAAAMGPDPDLAEKASTTTVLICGKCCMDTSMPVVALIGDGS